MADQDDNALNNDQPQIETLQPDQNDAPAVETAEGGEAQTEAGADGENAEKPQEKPAKQRDFKQERIDRLTRERAEDARRIAAAEARAAAAEAIAAAGKEPDKPEKVLTEADVERLADEKLAAKAFTDGTNRILKEGLKEFPDFDDARRSFIDNFGDRAPKSFYDALIDLDNGHEVFHAVAKDPELADRLLGMSATKMALELGKLANRPKTAPTAGRISSVPQPIAPIRGNGAPQRSLYDDKLPTNDWIAKRNADIAARKGAR